MSNRRQIYYNKSYSGNRSPVIRTKVQMTKDSIALNNIGWALIKLGNYTGAITYLDKALKIDPNYKLALNNKAWALNQLHHS
jgi:tetratricopeptide (TPR) repeat protein